MNSDKNIPSVPSLTPENSLKTLIENRTVYNLESCELNLFETYEKSAQVPLKFNDLVVTTMLKDLNLKAKDVPLIAGEVVNADQKGACASMNNIIGTLPKTIPTAHVVSSAGCTSRPDHLHFTAAGYRELGTRYAQAMLPLLGYKVAEPK